MQKHSIIEVLGCSGSIGIPNQGTTSYLLDDDILIDAGTGLCDLAFERLEKISHVFLSHSHLDHVCGVAFLVETVGVGRTEPLHVYGLEATINSLKSHIFNWSIWPDFTQIPNADTPVMVYHIIDPAQEVVIDQRKIWFTEVDHTVPTVAIGASSPTGGWLFSGDTWNINALVKQINDNPSIRYFFVETAFPDKEKWLAELAKHLCPSMLFEQLKGIRTDCEVWISHLKPKDHELIRRELYLSELSPQILSAGMKFSF